MPDKDIKDKQKGNSIELVIFQITNQKFALPLTEVNRVIQIVEIRTLPKTPKYVCGIINMHGEVISVINMRRLFGMPQKELELTDKLLIVSTSRIKMALWIDEVHNVIEIDTKDLVNSDEIKYGKKNIKGIVKLESGMVLLNDVEKFLNPEELEELENAIQEAKLQSDSVNNVG
jgi:purine-binding chemotaxis protein CheW